MSEVPRPAEGNHLSTSNRRQTILRMPIQLNNPSQVSSNIVRMVSNMLPQFEQQLNAQMSEPELADMAEMVLPGHIPAAPQTRNPYLAAGRGHAHGHSRSHSYSYGGDGGFMGGGGGGNFMQRAFIQPGGATSSGRNGAHGLNPYPYSHDAHGMTSHRQVPNQATSQLPTSTVLTTVADSGEQSTSATGVSGAMSRPQMPFHPAMHSQSHGATGPQGINTENSTESNQNPSTPSINGDNQNFVVDFGVSNPPAEDNNNNGRQAANNNNSNPLSNVRTIWKATQGIPFLILLLAKIFYDHRLGILCLIGLFGTYYHANSSLKRQIAQRDLSSVMDTLGNLCWIVVFLAANICFIYYVFDDEKLYRSLYFQVPEFTRVDIWTLFWIVCVTDFVIKYATIIVKAAVALVPRQILPVKKKGKHYMLVEVLSQFYRCLTPVVPWVLYLQAAPHGGQVFSYILVALYTLFKLNHLWGKSKEVRKAFMAFRLDVSYGTGPRREDLQRVDNICPICQDKLTDPVKLTCSHIFCEDCVSMWFDREKTCPMCRAQIVDNPMWRDGTTSATIEMF